MRSSCADVDGARTPARGLAGPTRRAVLGLLAAPLVGPRAAPVAAPGPGGTLWSVDIEHVVQRGDSLTRVGARYGIAPALVAQQNRLRADAGLRPGQVLAVHSRHLLPQLLADGVTDGILINAAQRMLWRRRGGVVEAAAPVTVGRHDWPTPLGPFRVDHKQTDKTWIVPPSIQDEMRRQGKPVLTRVPPGPDNPLGRHWIGLSMPAIGIHGTNAPASIYGYRSHGCIRMHADDVAALYEQVTPGMPGRIAYQTLLWLRDGDDRIWFEAHPDPYRREASDALAAVRRDTERAGVAARIDWLRVERLVRQRDGQARRIDLDQASGGQSAP